MENIFNLWMECHVRQAMDGQVYVGGSDSDPHAVRATIEFVLSSLGYNTECKLIEPTRQQIIDWMTNNNMADEVEYLMEE